MNVYIFIALFSIGYIIFLLRISGLLEGNKENPKKLHVSYRPTSIWVPPKVVEVIRKTLKKSEWIHIVFDSSRKFYLNGILIKNS